MTPTTLTEIARQERIPIDSLRRFVRERADLRVLGHSIGVARVLNAAEREAILSAWANRHASPQGAEPVGAS